jgi:hypothetical protein
VLRFKYDRLNHEAADSATVFGGVQLVRLCDGFGMPAARSQCRS